MEASARRLIKHKNTSSRSILDFPAVCKFVESTFPAVNLRGIPIYICDGPAMRRCGFDGMNGCYIPFMKCIFVRRDANVSDNADGKFFKILHKKIQTPLNADDIVVHELLHAVSDGIERPTRHYTNAEEEFVFTNCVEYYKSKGMNEEEIKSSVLIAFCINNVMSSKTKMSTVFAKLKEKIHIDVVPWEKFFTREEYLRFLNAYADEISDLVIELAKEDGTNMLESYYNMSRKDAPVSYKFHSGGSRFDLLDWD